ncbi:hypothetical protein MJG53_016761 [Ovis ammon polii x Ovis aries]|uniref:Uncharacterized protein n=1 Tax=Ovis ammon polii x Ovis aries TaxID=2918886 RepID=A0ACB9U9K9_9CETA|nr:hypothetical protein MJG53_016761 [Ovis ammon polii x Ovis aries]
MDLQALCRAGVPVRSGDATFPKAMDNVTVRQGESATLRMPFPPSSEFDSTLFQTYKNPLKVLKERGSVIRPMEPKRSGEYRLL